jgi:hypothetical protein
MSVKRNHAWHHVFKKQTFTLGIHKYIYCKHLCIQYVQSVWYVVPLRHTLDIETLTKQDGSYHVPDCSSQLLILDTFLREKFVFLMKLHLHYKLIHISK